MRHAGTSSAPRYRRQGNEDPQSPVAPIERPAAGRRAVQRKRRSRRLVGLGAIVAALAISSPVVAFACGVSPADARDALARAAAPTSVADQIATTAARPADSPHLRWMRHRRPGTPSMTAAPRSTPALSPSESATATAAPSASAPPAAAPSASSPADVSGASSPVGLPLYRDLTAVTVSANVTVDALKQQMQQKTVLGQIAEFPRAHWFVDDSPGWTGQVSDIVAAAAADHSVAELVAYNIPHRDCGAFSAGGAASADAYRAWIRSYVAALGNHRVIMVIEPDAIGLAPQCLDAGQRAERYALIKYAAQQFEAQGSWTYIDAGNSAWLSVSDATAALQASGIADATGFALNTAQSRSNAELIPYGDKVSAAVGGKHYVIDSGRNGIAPTNFDWCNPPGKGIGHRPTTDTGHALLDAFLWIKGPGGSDGNCNGGPNAGAWFDSYAAGLLARAHLDG